jgi:hypothetical protein
MGIRQARNERRELCFTKIMAADSGPADVNAEPLRVLTAQQPLRQKNMRNRRADCFRQITDFAKESGK